MIVVMKAGATEQQILNVQKVIREIGFKDYRIHGEERSVVAVLGHVYPELTDELGVIDGVDSVVRISKPYKLASREVQSENTVVRIGGLAIGDGSVCVMAATPWSWSNMTSTRSAWPTTWSNSGRRRVITGARWCLRDRYRTRRPVRSRGNT